MMRKFPKLLAVVLAIAIIICPAMCLTSMAETPANDYTVSYANDVVTVKVDAANGFLVALLRLDVEGFDVNEAGIAVTTTEGVEFGANPDFDADAGVLSLLLAAKDAANINVVTSATVTIPVTKTATDDNYGIKLTTIQAADAGSVVDGVLKAEDFIDGFPGVTDAEDGTINADEVGDKVVAIKPCTHENTTENTTASTCTVQGSVTVTCDDCGATISSESLPLAEHVAGKYEFDENYHWNVCTYGCSEKLNKAEHVFDDDADADCICGFTREVEPEVEYTLNRTSVAVAGLASQVQFGFKYTGISFSHPAEIAEFGVLMQCVDNYNEETGVVVGGTKVIPFAFKYAASYDVRIQNIPLANFGKDYVFVLFAKLNDGTYVYGPEDRLSYAEDYLLPRKTAGVKVGSTTVSETVAARANAYLAAYYELTGDAAYAEFAATVADQSKTYTSTIEKKTYTNPNADPRLTHTSVEVKGLASQIQFGLKFNGISFTNPEEIAEFGVLMQCVDNYNEDTGVVVGGTKVIPFAFNYTNAYDVRIQNIPLANFGKDYIFVLYAKLNDGTYIYGEYESVNYVGDYLVPRLKNANAKTASRAYAYITAYEKLTGKSVYTAS